MMSSALPLATPSFSGMSRSTTSASSLRPASIAISPPMLPAPITAIFLRCAITFILIDYRRESPRADFLLHVLDDFSAELRALHLRRAFHQTVEVVRNRLGADRAVEAL